MLKGKAYTVRQKPFSRQQGKGQATEHTVIKFINLLLSKSRSDVDVGPIYWPDGSGSIIMNYGPQESGSRHYYLSKI
jgi:hypothetical protein